LLVCDGDGAILLLDPETGKPRWPEPINLTAGVMLATPRPVDRRATATRPAAASPIYCYDSFTISAIDAVAGRLLWRSGDWPSQSRRQHDDPEDFDRTLAAHETPDGLLAVRDDGAVGLLDAANGSLHWRLELGSAAQARLHVSDDAAWILWRGDGRASAARVQLDRPAEVGRRIDLGEVLPIWSEPLDGGLLVVWTNRIELLSPSGECRDFEDLPVASIQQRSIHLEGTPNAPLVVLADIARTIHAYEARTGKLRWRTEEISPPASTPWSAMTVGPEWIALVAPDALAVYAVDSGKREYSGAGLRTAPGGLFVHGHTLYAVASTDSVEGTPAGQDASAVLLLRSLCLAPVPGKACSGSLPLDIPAADVRRIIPLADLLIVETASRLTAFRLPACTAHNREKPASRPAGPSGGDGSGR
jgi:hypothetical protein